MAHRYVAVDVHLTRQCRFMVAREKPGGKLATIAEFRNALDRDDVVRALNEPQHYLDRRQHLQAAE